MLPLILFGAAELLPRSAHASLTAKRSMPLPNGIAWVVVVIAPIIGVAVFWLVHVTCRKKSLIRKSIHRPHAIHYLCSLWQEVALANCMALGIHQAGNAQARLRRPEIYPSATSPESEG